MPRRTGIAPGPDPQHPTHQGVTVTDRPYTDDDLRAEAARQHASLTTDPDFLGIGEQMEGHKIPSRGDFQWDQLGDDDYDTARDAVDDLLANAANTSEWAINLGVDGLEPSEQRLDIGADPKARVRIHFAFAPDMSDMDRRHFIAEIAAATITSF